MSSRTISLLAILLAASLAGPSCKNKGEAVSVSVSPEEAKALEADAQTKLQQGDFAAAIVPLKKLARADPEASDVFQVLGGSVKRAPNHDALAAEARTDLATNPDDPVALTIAVNALPLEENQKERITYLRRLVEVRPADDEQRRTLAKELVNAFLYDEALPHLERLLANENESPLTYYLRGKVRFFRPTPDHSDHGVTDFQKAIELKPDFAWAHVYLGKALLTQGKPEQAIPELRRASEFMPNHLEVVSELLRAYRDSGDKEHVAELSVEFARLRNLEERSMALVTRCGAFPNDVDLRIETVSVLMEKGEYERAIPFLKRAMRLRPDDPKVKSLAEKLQQGMSQRAGQGEP